MYVAVILFALGNGLMWPSFMSILSKLAGTVLQGAVQGVAGSFGGLASIIGLILREDYCIIRLEQLLLLVSAGVIFAVFIMSFRLQKMK